MDDRKTFDQVRQEIDPDAFAQRHVQVLAELDSLRRTKDATLELLECYREMAANARESLAQIETLVRKMMKTGDMDALGTLAFQVVEARRGVDIRHNMPRWAVSMTLGEKE